MKYTKLILISISLMMMSACSVVQDLTPSQAALAQLAIRASVVEVVTKDALTAKDTAVKIIEIATETKGLIDSGVVSAVGDLDVKIRERISELNLTPAKAIIVDSLLAMVKAEIQARVTGNVLNKDTVVIVAKVLDIIIETAKAYK